MGDGRVALRAPQQPPVLLAPHPARAGVPAAVALVGPGDHAEARMGFGPALAADPGLGLVRGAAWIEAAPGDESRGGAP